MGEMELTSRKRLRRNHVSALVLESVKVAGLLGVALVAPNVIGAMAKLGIIATARDGELVKRAVDRLYDKGHLKHVKGKLALTNSGKEALRVLDLKFQTWKPPKRWDKQWRVLVFDIPETKKGLRDRIRRTLESIGFRQLQRSVWVYPYDCEDWITLWKAEFKVGSEMLYMIVNSIEGESVLKRAFDLKS